LTSVGEFSQKFSAQQISAQQTSDILGNLFALNPGPIFVEVRQILIRIQVLHHECMLVVHWNPSRAYNKKGATAFLASTRSFVAPCGESTCTES
jgi:hypothetical protein